MTNELETVEPSAESLDKMKEVIRELLAYLGCEGKIEVEKFTQGGKETIVFNIESEDSNHLIGQYGANLAALQHICRMLVRKKVTEKVNFIIDINSYRTEKNESVLKLAQTLADQAILEKRAVLLRPMSPYERRLIHLELSKNDKVTTESIGEGENRKVVIRPVDLF